MQRMSGMGTAGAWRGDIDVYGVLSQPGLALGECLDAAGIDGCLDERERTGAAWTIDCRVKAQADMRGVAPPPGCSGAA
jgi:hypothetical protein